MDQFSKVLLNNFKVDASCGIYDGDDKIKTPLSVMIEVGLNISSIHHDIIDETMNYELLANMVRASTKTHYALLETMAEHYISEIFKHEKVINIRIKIIKTSVFSEGECGIDWFRNKTI